jgi:hypothetical protein
MTAPIRYSDTSTISIDDNAKTLLLLAGVVAAGVATYVIIQKIGFTTAGASASNATPAPTPTPTPIPTANPESDLPVVQTPM